MAVNNKTFYEILEVEQDADFKEIRKSFRRLSKKYHPDLSKEDTEEKFQEIQKAYDVLSKEDLRKEYDMALKYGTTKRQTFEDLWSKIKTNQPKVNGKDVHLTLKTTIETLAMGGVTKLNYHRLERCDCQLNKEDICQSCQGTGKKLNVEKTIIGEIKNIKVCEECNGYGIPLSKHDEGCNGEFKKKQKEIEVNLTNREFGETLLLVGKGNLGVNGGMNGSLYIHIVESDQNKKLGKGYELINEERNDVKKDIPIKMSEFLSEQVTIKMPNGESVKTTPELNTIKVFNGKSFGKEGEKGDVYIKFTLDLNGLTKDKKQKLLKFWREEIED